MSEPTALSPGSQIGPYQVIRLLGEGGMGAVFEAVHQAIGRKVAIKVLHPEFAHNKELTTRFFNEARAVNSYGCS
jgi:serine/threonine-protein kinase